MLPAALMTQPLLPMTLDGIPHIIPARGQETRPPAHSLMSARLVTPTLSCGGTIKLVAAQQSSLGCNIPPTAQTLTTIHLTSLRTLCHPPGPIMRRRPTVSQQ